MEVTKYFLFGVSKVSFRLCLILVFGEVQVEFKKDREREEKVDYCLTSASGTDLDKVRS